MTVHEYELVDVGHDGWLLVVATGKASMAWQVASGIAGLVATVTALDAIQ